MTLAGRPGWAWLVIPIDSGFNYLIKSRTFFTQRSSRLEEMARPAPRTRNLLLSPPPPWPTFRSTTKRRQEVGSAVSQARRPTKGRRLASYSNFQSELGDKVSQKA